MAFDPDEWRRAADFGTRRRPGPDLDRLGWSLVAVVGVSLILSGLGQLIAGPLDPVAGYRADPAFRRGHLALVVALGALTAGLAARPLRRGERWSWALLWTVPAALVVVALLNRGVDGTIWPVPLGMAAVAAAGLLLAARDVGGTERWR